MDLFEKMMEGQVRKWMRMIRENPDLDVPPSVLDYYFRRKAGVNVVKDDETEDDEKTE